MEVLGSMIADLDALVIAQKIARTYVASCSPVWIPTGASLMQCIYPLSTKSYYASNMISTPTPYSSAASLQNGSAYNTTICG
jgi:hypothetical protein